MLLQRPHLALSVDLIFKQFSETRKLWSPAASELGANPLTGLHWILLLWKSSRTHFPSSLLWMDQQFKPPKPTSFSTLLWRAGYHDAQKAFSLRTCHPISEYSKTYSLRAQFPLAWLNWTYRRLIIRNLSIYICFQFCKNMSLFVMSLFCSGYSVKWSLRSIVTSSFCSFLTKGFKHVLI